MPHVKFSYRPPSSCESERVEHEQILQCLRIQSLVIYKESVNKTYLRKKERPQPKGESFCRVRESLFGFKGESEIGTVVCCWPVQKHRCAPRSRIRQPATTITTLVPKRPWSCLVK